MSNLVKKRETYYLSGFDPRGARSYYNLYKKESKKNEKIDDLVCNISSRSKKKEHIQSWSINATHKSNEMRVETQYHFLEWDDIIRVNWKKNFIQMFMVMLSFMHIYFLKGAIVKLAKLTPQGLRPILFPAFYMLLIVLLAYLLFIFVFHYASTVLYLPVAVFLSAIPVYYLIDFFHKLGNKIAVYWVARSMRFYGKYAIDDHSDLDKRIAYFAKTIRESIQYSKENNIDEVLIVAHSAGTVVLMELLYEILKPLDPNDTKLLDNVSVMTLGQCIPLVSFLDNATEYREKMSHISKYTFDWVDVSAPADAVSLALVDYFVESGITSGNKPNYISPRFHTLFDAKKYKKMKRDLYLMHFLYIMVTDKIGAYNFFQITAGDKRLNTIIKGNKK